MAIALVLIYISDYHEVEKVSCLSASLDYCLKGNLSSQLYKLSKCVFVT